MFGWDVFFSAFYSNNLKLMAVSGAICSYCSVERIRNGPLIVLFITDPGRWLCGAQLEISSRLCASQSLLSGFCSEKCVLTIFAFYYVTVQRNE